MARLAAKLATAAVVVCVAFPAALAEEVALARGISTRLERPGAFPPPPQWWRQQQLAQMLHEEDEEEARMRRQFEAHEDLRRLEQVQVQEEDEEELAMRQQFEKYQGTGSQRSRQQERTEQNHKEPSSSPGTGAARLPLLALSRNNGCPTCEKRCGSFRDPEWCYNYNTGNAGCYNHATAAKCPDVCGCCNAEGIETPGWCFAN